MSLHLYFVLVPVWLCLSRLYLIRFVCLLCQCLFEGNVPLYFILKSSRPSLTNSVRNIQHWVVRGSFCTPSTTHLTVNLKLVSLNLMGISNFYQTAYNSKETDCKLQQWLKNISKCPNCSSVGCLKCVQFHNWFRLH